VLKDAGSNLSVGVLQKINIARMLIHKPRILLCESATSALDPTTELEVCTLIKNEFKDVQTYLTQSTIIEI
jgi:ABC-type multidrug transport system fused ATPase/permease subunit